MTLVELVEEIITEVDTMDSVDEILFFLEELRDELIINEETQNKTNFENDEELD